MVCLILRGGSQNWALPKTHQRKEDNRSPVWRQPCHAGRAKKGAIVTGVDLSSEQVRLARKAAKYIGVDVELVEADWQDLPRSISKNYFDLVVTECGIFIDPQTGRMDEKRLESAWKMRQTDRFGFSPAFTDH